MLNETMEQRDPCAVLGLPISLEETDTDVQNSTHMGLQLRRACANNHRFGASTLWGSSCKLSIGFPPPLPKFEDGILPLHNPYANCIIRSGVSKPLRNTNGDNKSFHTFPYNRHLLARAVPEATKFKLR